MEKLLGQFKKLDLKHAWSHEQYDFTPWLAEDENIQQLADALGIELEVEDIEVSVGPYSADILAKGSGTTGYVVIENQFGKTNHDHLGKLLTYGAVLDVHAVIWVAETFTEEHKKALDWLNDHTNEEIGFYGVALELWQINDSLPAIRFNVVSRPNEIVKKASVAKDNAELTDVKRMQLEFWSAFRDRLLAKKVYSSAQVPRPQYWFELPLGRTNVYLALVLDTSGGRLGVRVYMGNAIARSMLAELEKDKLQIEAEVGTPLEWDANPDAKDKTIAQFLNVDVTNRDNWPEYIDWMIERVIAFRAAFSTRVKKAVIAKNNLPN